MAGTHLWIQPVPANTVIAVDDDAGINTGIYVRSILAQPSISLPAKYVRSRTELLTMGQMLRVWEKVTGKEAKYLECSLEGYEGLWSVMGKELALQLNFNKAVPDYTISNRGILTEKDLGVRKGLVGFEEALKRLEKEGSWD